MPGRSLQGMSFSEEDVAAVDWYIADTVEYLEISRDELEQIIVQVGIEYPSECYDAAFNILRTIRTRRQKNDNAKMGRRLSARIQNTI
jgi:hypothetical protein